MIEMNDAVRSAIAANLPAAVAGELAAFIKQAEVDKATLARTRESLTKAEQEADQLRAKLSEESALDAKVKQLAADQQTLRNEQLALAVRNARMEADVANASKNATLDVVSMFLKLPTVRTNVMSSVAVPVEGNPGNPASGHYPMSGTVMTAQESHATTQTQE